MSSLLLLRVGLVGTLLSAAAYLGTKVRPNAETPISPALRTTLLSVSAIFFILGVVPHLSSATSLQVLLCDVAGTMEQYADRWLSPF